MKYVSPSDPTKISDYFNLLMSNDTMVLKLDLKENDFIDLSIFFNKVTDSFTARFVYDLFNLSPKYFYVDAILLAVIEEQGNIVFHDELLKYEAKFKNIFETKSILIANTFQNVEYYFDKLDVSTIKIKFFFDSDIGEFILDYDFTRLSNDYTISDFHKKSKQITDVLNEIIGEILRKYD